MSHIPEWQDIANELSDGIRELHTALENYNKALDNADDLRSTIKDEALLDSFSDAWNEAEVAVSSIEDNIRDMAKLTDFIEEKLV